MASGPTFGAGDVISVAFDITGGKLWWANNGTWILGGNPATGANPVVTGLSGTFFGVGGQGSGGAATQTANFGLGSFVYTVPLGFTAGFT